MTSGLEYSSVIAQWIASQSLTHPANSDTSWLRCRLWHLSARIFRKQESEWRWHLRRRQHLFSEYQHHSSIRLCPRRRFGPVLDILHSCPCIYKTIHLDYWYLEYPLRHRNRNILLHPALLLCRCGLCRLWYLQYCTYMSKPILPMSDDFINLKKRSEGSRNAFELTLYSGFCVQEEMLTPISS